MKNKKGSAWLWILIILVFIIAAAGLYFLFVGGDSGPIIGGNSIPQPPALPN